MAEQFIVELDPDCAVAVLFDVVFQLSTLFTFIFSAGHLVIGLVAWPAGSVHAYGVTAWLLMFGVAWFNPSRKPALGCVALSLAVCHAMRWSGLEFAQFGPGLSATALVLLLLRDISRWTSNEPAASEPRSLRADRIIVSSMLVAMAGLGFGLWGMATGLQWSWCLTLAESALFVATLTIIVRRDSAKVWKAELVVHEMFAWLPLALSVVAAVDVHAANIPLAGPTWILIGMLFLLLGMAGEAIVSTLSGKAQPEPFLESRHLAALGLALYGLFDALFVAHPAFTEGGLMWRTLFALSAFAIYESFARCTSNENWNRALHKLAAGCAYLVLLPVGYLLFLFAHSNGGSWGAMYFMLLAPVLIAAAHVLRHEHQEEQAALAELGAAGVNVGALILAFAGNHQHLAAVPAVTLGAIALQLLLVRAVRSDAWFTAAACAALAGTVHFGSQALMGFPLGGPGGLWSLQMPILALLGVVMAMAGGIFKLEETPLSLDRASERGSLVAFCGVSFTSLAAFVALIAWIGFGERAGYPLWPNTAYFDAALICVMLLSAAALCASRWLREVKWISSLSQLVAPVATLAGYAMFVFKEPHAAWEWYTLPAAGFLFTWAREAVRENGDDANAEAEQRIAILLFFASVLAIGPSFYQAIDHAQGTGHFIALLTISLAVVFGAMLSRRKIPLMIGTGALIAGTIIKAAQWAHHREGLLPLLGILLGFALVAVSTLFESRMNQAFHKVVDRARAEARMFWVQWR